MIFKVPGTAEEGSPFAIAEPLCHLWTCYGSPAASCSRVSRGFELVGSEGFTACPLGIKPGESASVHKGIWRAWWKPPCYLVRVQRGAFHASLPTWNNKKQWQCKMGLSPITYQTSGQYFKNVRKNRSLGYRIAAQLQYLHATTLRVLGDVL